MVKKSLLLHFKSLNALLLQVFESLLKTKQNQDNKLGTSKSGHLTDSRNKKVIVETWEDVL